MTTPTAPEVTISVSGRPTAEAPLGDDVVMLVGPGGPGATLAPGTLSPVYLDRATARTAVGSSGPVYDALDGIYGQVRESVMVSLTPDKASALDGAINDAVTSVTVDDGSKYAAGDLLIVESEQMDVSSVAGNVLTVERGANSTTAAAHDDDTAVSAPPTSAQSVAALNLVSQANMLPTVLYAPGQTAGPTGEVTAADAVASRLNIVAEDIGGRAIGDAPRSTLNNALTWAGGNTDSHLLGIFNSPDGKNPGGYWLGAALRQAILYGLQRGIEHAEVDGVLALQHALSHNALTGTNTDVSLAVAGYLSVLVAANGRTEIIGETFRQVSTAERHWSVARVVDNLRRVLAVSARRFLNRGNTESLRDEAANTMERAGRRLVARGFLTSLTVVPNPAQNTAENIALGQAFFIATAGVITPLGSVSIVIEI